MMLRSPVSVLFWVCLCLYVCISGNGFLDSKQLIGQSHRCLELWTLPLVRGKQLFSITNSFSSWIKSGVPLSGEERASLMSCFGCCPVTVLFNVFCCCYFWGMWIPKGLCFWLLKLFTLLVIILFLFPGGKAPWECLGKRPAGVHNS
jgi:hypothetical protein